MKNDEGKARWDLLPFDKIDDVVAVLTHGAATYGDNNWRTVERERYVAALMRHFVAWRRGEINDAETGRHHLAHLICNALFLMDKEE